MRTSLSVKITAMLLIFFAAALGAIVVTLFMSWQLKGSSAAINEAGSLRMKIYQVDVGLARMVMSPTSADLFSERLRTQIANYDRTLKDLRDGDPNRPLFIPKGGGIPQDVEHLERIWVQELRPGLVAIANDPDTANIETGLRDYNTKADAYVLRIDEIVRKMENSFAHSTSVVQASQVSLIALAVLGTLLLIRFFFVQVIKPVGELTRGIERIEREDFGVRIEVLGDDELSRLSEGFNRTAAHLQDVYATLEERVNTKTRTLTKKNRELEILYSISGFLHEPSDIDSLCRGFLQRVQSMLGATASSVRLLDSNGKNLCITVCEGLDEEFLDRETVLACSDCVCGAAAHANVTLFADVGSIDSPITLDACRIAGFRTVTASAISANKRPIGVFSLYFDRLRALGETDRHLLEALGQQLGTAIDNLRLQAREREMAVSEERNLLARELHDSIAQSLAFLNLQVQMFDDAIARNAATEMRDILEMIRLGVQESYEDVRELLVHFRTRVGEQRDLDAAIDAALRRLADQTTILTDLEVQGDGAPLDPETETQVLYIVQEALSNVRKHANAHTVTVLLRRALEGMSVTIRDDGIGFDTESTDCDEQSHIGLQIMKERAARIGGRFYARSSRGKGTEIRLDLHRTNKETA